MLTLLRADSLPPPRVPRDYADKTWFRRATDRPPEEGPHATTRTQRMFWSLYLALVTAGLTVAYVAGAI